MDQAAVSCSAAAPASRGWRWLIPIAILATAVCTLTNNQADTDLWGHVTYGRDWLRDGELPRTTTWSYITNTTPWINHENLSELAFALTYDTFGVLGFTFGKLLLATVIVTSLVYTARRSGAGWGATAICVVAAADAMEFHWHFRPQAFTYTFFALEIVLLDWVFRDWRGDWRGWRETFRGAPGEIPREAVARLPWLCLLPLLFILWTNTHGGFAAGVAISSAYLAFRACEAWAWWGTTSLMLIMRIGFLIAMGLLATFLTPYGGELHAWMWKAIAVPQPEISDWRPIDLFHDSDAIGIWVLFVLGAISLGCSRRRKDLTQFAILGIVLWQGLEHVRHLVFFAILCGAWLPQHVGDVLGRIAADLKDKAGEKGKRLCHPQAVELSLVGWTALMIVLTLGRVRDIPIRKDWYPVGAMQFVADRGLEGRFLVDFNWAQYAIMCFDETGARSRVAIDGRYTTCYSREALDLFLDFQLGDLGPEHRRRGAQSPPFNPHSAIRIGPPDLVLISRERPQSVEVMRQSGKDWVLLYQDSLTQLWGRAAKYDRHESLDYLPLAQRLISDATQAGAVSWPAVPRRSKRDPLTLASR